jgi:hypothetical protein
MNPREHREKPVHEVVLYLTAKFKPHRRRWSFFEAKVNPIKLILYLKTI